MRKKKDDLTVDFEEIIEEDFTNDEFCIAYLNQIMQDYEPSLMLLAIRRIIKARQLKMTDIAKKSGLSRSVLYHALSPQGNPSFATLLPILTALGIEIRFGLKQRTA